MNDHNENTLEAFIKKNPLSEVRRGRTSIIKPYHDDVVRLRKMGYTIRRITEYLNDYCGVTVNQSLVTSYCYRIRHETGMKS